MTMGQKSTYQSKGESETNNRKFNPARLTFARIRRGLTKTDLAKAVDLSSRSITGYESGEFLPEAERLEHIASFLKFPPSFFYEEEDVEEISSESVSFRAMTKMSATLKKVALGAGAIAVQLNSWIEDRFTLPDVDIPDLGPDTHTEAAAQTLRHHWGLGEQPIKNMVHLLEAKGVRVYSLAIHAREVDAFSIWWNGKPFIFLNTQKSGEHSRFDAAHELGHLVLHRHGQPHGQDAEKEANTFASAFLMPEKSILATQLRFPTLDNLIYAKRHWAVSVAAFNYRLHAIGLTTEWINRSLCIEIARAGYRTKEPQTIPHETSQVLEKVFAALREEGVGKSEIALALHVSVHEIDELTYGLLKLGAVPEPTASGNSRQVVTRREKPILTLVK